MRKLIIRHITILMSNTTYTRQRGRADLSISLIPEGAARGTELKGSIWLSQSEDGIGQVDEIKLDKKKMAAACKLAQVKEATDIRELLQSTEKLEYAARRAVEIHKAKGGGMAIYSSNPKLSDFA